ncbi:MAG: methylenetetrahydrofolate reductase C-terminal domain-containing protein [Clostridia bacterium]|nr:methylenetetrahydrofolate reductase C-terminal domain-containing protein [Clostridia bacterium]
MAFNRFREKLNDPKEFCITWEVVPGRGGREKAQAAAIADVKKAAEGGIVDAVTITDAPGGNPAMAADWMGAEVLKEGIEPLVHFTCKDRNRNQIESQLYALDRHGVRNLLLMTGDYVSCGFCGCAKPVFDLDPIHLLLLIGEMNRGLTYSNFKGEPISHKPCDFFAGAAVSPFKWTEAESFAQYNKMFKKAQAGAAFFVTQMGFDMRKNHELLLFAEETGIKVPVIANLYVPTLGTAKNIFRGAFPGCSVTEVLINELAVESKAADKGIAARLERAAKMYAVLKGMGFSGVHIGGFNLKYEQVEQIISRGEELLPSWQSYIKDVNYPVAGGYYRYELDNATGLNKESKTPVDFRKTDDKVGGVYRISRFVHKAIFEPNRACYGAASAVCRAAQGRRRAKPLTKIEHLAKVMMYDCKDCGDCALMDTAYTCPMSRCPKNQRNGACGGSQDGWCEVYPNQRKCIYVKAYSRLKNYREKLPKYLVDPCNWDLYQTSSWINFYMGWDHSAKRLNIKKQMPREKK